MTWEDQLIKELADKYGLNNFVVQTIIKSPFLFIKDKMCSLEDTRSIRLPYFGAFVYRDYRYPGVNKQVMLLNKVVRIIKDEMAEPHSEEFKKGLKKAEEIIREQITARRGKPADFGLEEDESI